MYMKPALILVLISTALSCVRVTDASITPPAQKRKVDFPVAVTRDGQAIPEEAVTKSGAESSDRIATMDTSIPFGLVGVDYETGSLILDNEAIVHSGDSYSGFFDSTIWDIPATITFSAYYPHVKNVAYADQYQSYSIPFDNADTEAGPMVSKTVQQAIDQLNIVPLQFQHITNDIGFKICDVTTDPGLQGLIHLRKVTATKIASAGIFVNDIVNGNGFWHCRGYYRDEVVFEGDALVGVGMENEKFIGRDALVPRMSESYRFYAIPDELEVGKQYVEIEFDIDGFDVGGYHYKPLTGLKAKYMLYGVLPDNVMAYGKQYTFHLGLDTGQYYHEITFAPSVSEWETKIYENNDEF